MGGGLRQGRKKLCSLTSCCVTLDLEEVMSRADADPNGINRRTLMDCKETAGTFWKDHREVAGGGVLGTRASRDHLLW